MIVAGALARQILPLFADLTRLVSAADRVNLAWLSVPPIGAASIRDHFVAASASQPARLGRMIPSTCCPPIPANAPTVPRSADS